MVDLRWGRSIPIEDIDNLDPMSLWIMGHGRDFAGHLLSDSAGSDLDFRFVAAIDAANPISSLRNGRSLVAIMNEDLDTNTGLIVQDLKSSLFYTKLAMENPRLFLLPLRSQSVLTPAAEETLRRIEPKFTVRRSQYRTGAQPPRPVIGIIDHGINFAHERFRDGMQSNIDFAWDQGGVYQQGSDVPFGREFQGHQITQILRDSDGCDAEALRRMGLTDFERPGERPLARRLSHGTHVLDLAAGATGWEEQSQAPHIIAVNLPPVVAREPSGALLGIFFIQAVEYILNCARGLSNPGPVTLNFSFALSGGPRRGRHVLERSMEALLDHHDAQSGPPANVVLPAGNRNVAGGHAVQHMHAPDDLAEFTWQLQPCDATSNMLEIWLSGPPKGRDFNPPAKLEITPPGGAPVTAVFDSFTEAARPLRLGDDVIGQVIRQPSRGERFGPADSFSLTIILAGTDPGLSGRTPTPPGPWKIRVELKDATDVTAEAWVMRDDTIPGFNDNGRQSYLLDPQVPQRDRRGVPLAEGAGDEGVRPAGTLNALATCGRANVVTVGAATQQMGTTETQPRASLYSATPLPEDSPLNAVERVDRSAIADRSPVLPGVLGAGTLSGTRMRMGGTSVAAPQVTRAIARGDVTVSAARGTDRRLGASVEAAPQEVRRKPAPPSWTRS